jgi:hypothetical protein
MTKQYFSQDKDGNINWYSKYSDDSEEQFNYDVLIEETGESFEEITIDKLLIESLPKKHRELAYKRYLGEKLSDSERSLLSRYQKRLRESISC